MSKSAPNIPSFVSLPCSVSGGAFSDERWIRVDAEHDRKPFAVTAFVPIAHVNDPQPELRSHREGSVKVRINYINNGHSSLIFPGELLSVSNPVRVDSSWLTKVGSKV